MEWAPVYQRIWDMKYRFRDASGAADGDLDATWWRVARALAAPERDPELWTAVSTRPCRASSSCRPAA